MFHLNTLRALHFHSIEGFQAEFETEIHVKLDLTLHQLHRACRKILKSKHICSALPEAYRVHPALLSFLPHLKIKNGFENSTSTVSRSGCDGKTNESLLTSLRCRFEQSNYELNNKCFVPE